MEITAAAAATVLAATAAHHYITANIISKHFGICIMSEILSALHFMLIWRRFLIFDQQNKIIGQFPGTYPASATPSSY